MKVPAPYESRLGDDETTDNIIARIIRRICEAFGNLPKHSLTYYCGRRVISCEVKLSAS